LLASPTSATMFGGCKRKVDEITVPWALGRSK
jgi:hypothetical protein